MLNVGINNCRYKKKTMKPNGSGDIENTDREYEPVADMDGLFLYFSNGNGQ
jgi:hypothetical protein